MSVRINSISRQSVITPVYSFSQKEPELDVISVHHPFYFPSLSSVILKFTPTATRWEAATCSGSVNRVLVLHRTHIVLSHHGGKVPSQLYVHVFRFIFCLVFFFARIRWRHQKAMQPSHQESHRWHHCAVYNITIKNDGCPVWTSLGFDKKGFG